MRTPPLSLPRAQSKVRSTTGRRPVVGSYLFHRPDVTFVTQTTRKMVYGLRQMMRQRIAGLENDEGFSPRARRTNALSI